MMPKEVVWMSSLVVEASLVNIVGILFGILTRNCFGRSVLHVQMK